jgi:hypothetical protein
VKKTNLYSSKKIEEMDLKAERQTGFLSHFIAIRKQKIISIMDKCNLKASHPFIIAH